MKQWWTGSSMTRRRGSPSYHGYYNMSAYLYCPLNTSLMFQIRRQGNCWLLQQQSISSFSSYLQVCCSRSEKDLDGRPGSLSFLHVKKLQFTSHKNLCQFRTENHCTYIHSYSNIRYFLITLYFSVTSYILIDQGPSVLFSTSINVFHLIDSPSLDNATPAEISWMKPRGFTFVQTSAQKCTDHEWHLGSVSKEWFLMYKYNRKC